MNLNDFNNSKYLAKTDVPEHGMTLTIAGFGIEEMRDGTKKPWVSWVQPGWKPMLLNKINRSRLASICSTDQTEAMIGKQVQVFTDPMVEMSGQVVGGLRIRPVPMVANIQSATLTQSEKELQDALALVRQRAQDAQRGGPASPADPNDEIPF
jgi:hypothetical protein